MSANVVEEPKKETPPEEEVPLTDYQLAVQQAQLAHSMGWTDEVTYQERLKEAESKATDEEKAKIEKERAEAQKKAENESTAKEVAEEDETEETDEQKEAKAKEVKEAAEAKAKSDAEAKAKAEEKKAADELKKSKRVDRERERETVDDETVQRAADLAAQKVLEQNKPTQPAPDTFESKLPKAYRKDLEVARFLAQSDPKQADLPGQFLQAYKTEGDYIAKWEAEHAGEEFDADADEHKQFYARTFPKIDEEEFDAAKEAMIEARVTERVEAKVQERIKPKVERVEVIEKLKETAQTHAAKGQEAMMSMLLAKDGDNPVFEIVHNALVDGKLTKEAVDKVMEEDPVVYEILDNEAGRVKYLTTELYRLAELKEPYRKLTEENAPKSEGAALAHQAHRELNAFALDLEDRLAGQKDEEGRKFLRQDQFDQRAVEILQSKTMTQTQKNSAIRDLGERYFTVTAEVIERELIKDSVKKSSQEIARINALFEKRTKGKQSAPPKKDETETTDNTEETPPEPKKAKPPTTVSASDKTNTGKKGGVQGVLTPEEFEKRAFM